MFDYRSRDDIQRQLDVQTEIIFNLEQQNNELVQQVGDYKTNLRLNKDAIRELLSSMQSQNKPSSPKHKRKASWWGTKPTKESSCDKAYFINTINKFVTENLNLQNEMFRVHEQLEARIKEISELRWKVARWKGQKEVKSKVEKKTVEVAIQAEVEAKKVMIKPKFSFQNGQTEIIARLRSKLRSYMKKLSEYQKFFGKLISDYSMPSELMANLQNMQVNDSFQLVKSYLDISSELDVNSQLYDYTLEDGVKKQDNTMELLEQDFSKELKMLKPDISSDITNKPTLHQNQYKVDEYGQKTNSYFNYIKRLDKSGASKKNENINDSFGMMDHINNSDSFHYKPSWKAKNDHLQTSAMVKKKPKASKQSSIERHNDRSLSLPKFDTFSACPEIKKTADFSEAAVRKEWEETNPEEGCMTPRGKIQESIKWEEDKIELSQASKIIKDDSLVDSFLLELTQRAPSDIKTGTDTSDGSRRTKNRGRNLLKMKDLKYAKPT
jgi:hypothetical protein